jgi:hypothetical protein
MVICFLRAMIWFLKFDDKAMLTKAALYIK